MLRDLLGLANNEEEKHILSIQTTINRYLNELSPLKYSSSIFNYSLIVISFKNLTYLLNEAEEFFMFIFQKFEGQIGARYGFLDVDSVNRST
jgi:hypothetical protein